MRLYGTLASEDEASTLLPDEATNPPETTPVSRARYVGLVCAATVVVAGVNHVTGGSIASMFQARAANAQVWPWPWLGLCVGV